MRNITFQKFDPASVDSIIVYCKFMFEIKILYNILEDVFCALSFLFASLNINL